VISREKLADWLLPVVPAFLAGAQLAAILFFLNPELPFGVLPVARATLYYTALGALPSIAFHRLLARWRGVAIARLLPWSLSVVAATGALGSAVHASHFALLLPEAMNRQLIKAALWTTLGAVLLFYTALLHAIHHRRYGLRSRLLVVLATVGAVIAIVDRRTSFRPPSSPPLSVAVDAPSETPRIVVVALPNATLESVLPLARQGRLPFFARLLESGAAARLEVPSPPREAAVWATWATGKLPYRHGIVDDQRWSAPMLGRNMRIALLPVAPWFPFWGLGGGRAEPLLGGDRHALTLWELLSRFGRPARALDFPDWLAGEGLDAPALVGAHTLSERELLASRHDQLSALLTDDRLRAERLRALLVDSAPGSALFVRLPGFGTASFELYGGFAAARFEAARSSASNRAAEAYEIYLGGIDNALAAIWESLPPPRLLAVTSAVGISAPRGIARLARALTRSDLELRGTVAGAPDGLLLLAGDGILAGTQLTGARSVDVVPTLLYAAGAPIARDFDGRVLAEVFEPGVLQRRALTFVPSFERIER
jgi:Type I phosphodiesterase / nucleotide pyrophosphatase